MRPPERSPGITMRRDNDVGGENRDLNGARRGSTEDVNKASQDIEEGGAEGIRGAGR